MGSQVTLNGSGFEVLGVGGMGSSGARLCVFVCARGSRVSSSSLGTNANHEHQ